MANLASINVRFLADLKQFSSQMQNANRKLQKTGKAFTNAGRNLTIGLTAPIVALGTASVIAFDKQAKAIAQVEAGLKSTGGAAGKTSEQLQALASELQGNSLFGDEEILKDVTAQLLTFTNIAGKQFDRTQQAALDLATRLDGDLKSASIQLGKALNDPIANLSALSRSGIQFSNDQKAVIKSLTESGKLAEAQTIILDELEKQYGGAAEAAARAGLGPFKQLSNSIGDLTEDFAAIIVDALLPFIDYIKEVVDRFKNLDDSTKKIIAIVAAFGAALGPVLLTIGFLATNVIPGLIAAFKALSVVIAANPIGVAVVAITALTVGVAAASGAFREYTDAAQEFNDITKTATGSIAKEKVAIDKLVSTAINEKESKEARTKALNDLQSKYPAYFKNLSIEKSSTDDITTATDKLTNALLKKARVQAAEEKLVDIQKRILDVQLRQADNIQPTLTDVYASAGSGLANVFAGAYNDVLKGKDPTENAFLNFAVGQTGALAKDVTDAAQKETAALTQLQDKLTDFINANQDVVTSVEPVVPAINKVVESVGEVKKLDPVQPLDIIDIDTSQPLIPEDYQLIAPEVVEQFDEQLARMRMNADAFNEGLSMAVTGAAENFAVGFGQVLGTAVNGGNFLQGFFNVFVSSLADMAIQVGKTAIGIGIAVIGIKKALTSLSGPVAIAAGVALVALGTLAKSALADISQGGPTPFANGGIVSGPVNALVGEYAGARNNPEVIAPLDKLKKLIEPASGMGTVVMEGEFVLRGNDLIRVINRTESRNNRTR